MDPLVPLDGLTFAQQMVKFIKNNTVAEELPNLIRSIPEGDRLNIINSHFEFRDRLSGQMDPNYSPLFVAIRELYSGYKTPPNYYSIKPDPDRVRTAVRILLDNGADPNIAPADSMYVNVSALATACGIGDLATVQLLFERGANINAERYGINAMTLLVDLDIKHYEVAIPYGISISFNTQQEEIDYYRNLEQSIIDTMHFLFANGFNKCKTAYPDSRRDGRKMELFKYVEKKLTYASRYYGRIRPAALRIILENCYRELELVEVNYNGERRLLPACIWNNKDWGFMHKEAEIYKDLYLRLIDEGPGRIPPPDDPSTYEKIYDDEPTIIMDDPVGGDDDVNVNSCIDRGFVAVMQTSTGYIYECISKENLVFWNSGRKRSQNNNIINLSFRGGTYTVTKPDWIRNQPIFDRINQSNADQLHIPNPKIFLIMDDVNGNKKLVKATFVGKPEAQASMLGKRDSPDDSGNMDIDPNAYDKKAGVGGRKSRRKSPNTKRKTKKRRISKKIKTRKNRRIKSIKRK